MSTTVARRPRVQKDFRTLVQKAEIFVLCSELSARELAKDLGASLATTSRVLAALRRKLKARGGELVCIRRGRRCHYEIREDRTQAWERMQRLAESVRGSFKGPPIREEDHDRLIYGD